MKSNLDLNPQICDDPGEEILAITRGEVQSWARIARVLHKVQETGYWRGSAKSFTAWFRAFSDSAGLEEATLWRLFGALRSYSELRGMLLRRSKRVDSALYDELPERVSPDKIELLSKLVRVLPDEAFDELAERAAKGTITRAELRRTWQTYRPALAGRTARGRGVAAPRVDRGDRHQADSLAEAEMVMALANGGVEQTVLELPAQFEIFQHVRPEFPANARRRFEFDVVVMTQARATGPLVLHGIEIKGTHLLLPSVYSLLEMQTPYCDFLWLAQVGGDDEIPPLPDHVGLLRMTGRGIDVVRRATHGEGCGSRTGDLAKGLLSRRLRR